MTGQDHPYPLQLKYANVFIYWFTIWLTEVLEMRVSLTNVKHCNRFESDMQETQRRRSPRHRGQQRARRQIQNHSNQLRGIHSTQETTAHPGSYSALRNSIFHWTRASSAFQSAGSFPKSLASSSSPLSSGWPSVSSMMGDKSLVTPGLLAGC